MGKKFEISEDDLQKLLSNATKQGIELGQQMVKSKQAIPITSPAFNAQRLFMQGRHPHLRTEIEEIFTNKGIRDGRGLATDAYFCVGEATFNTWFANSRRVRLTLLKTNKFQLVKGSVHCASMIE